MPMVKPKTRRRYSRMRLNLLRTSEYLIVRRFCTSKPSWIMYIGAVTVETVKTLVPTKEFAIIWN